MNLSEAPASPISAPTQPWSRPASERAARLTAVLPIATAIATAGVLVASASLHETLADLGFTLAFLIWNLLPAAGATALLLWAGRRGWLPYAAATLGCFALAGLTVWALHDFWTSDSSTAALVFISLPLGQWTAVLVSGGLAALATAWASRRTR